jgi:hypothetical protein
VGKEESRRHAGCQWWDGGGVRERDTPADPEGEGPMNNKKHARYEVVRETTLYILIQDTGHDRGYPTVTNDAANVVEELRPRLERLRGAGRSHTRELYYLDSEGRCDRILHVHGRFTGFAPCWRTEVWRDHDKEVGR